MLPAAATPSVRQLSKTEVGRNSTVLDFGGGGASTVLLCGGSVFRPGDHPLVAALPEVLLLRRTGDALAGDISGLLPILRTEAAHPRAGSETIITRLSDVLVTHALRTWLDRNARTGQGWLAAFHDERLGPALTAMHQQPAKPWTVAGLAAAAHLSRSSFAQRFAAAVGTPPIDYLTRLRMRLATEWITERGMTPSQVAPKIGYDSLAAFTRAYKRITGRTPGSARPE